MLDPKVHHYGDFFCSHLWRRGRCPLQTLLEASSSANNWLKVTQKGIPRAVAASEIDNKCATESAKICARMITTESSETHIQLHFIHFYNNVRRVCIFCLVHCVWWISSADFLFINELSILVPLVNHLKIRFYCIVCSVIVIFTFILLMFPLRWVYRFYFFLFFTY